jgi:hypothetical protein
MSPICVCDGHFENRDNFADPPSTIKHKKIIIPSRLIKNVHLSLNMMKVSAIALLFLTVVTTIDAARHSSTNSNVNHHRSSAAESSSSSSGGGNSYYRHLHDILQIKEDDPNQDIRTNIILNMEGL